MLVRLSWLPFLLGLCLPVTIGTWVGEAGGPAMGWTIGLLTLPVTLTAAFVVDRLVRAFVYNTSAQSTAKNAAIYAASQSEVKRAEGQRAGRTPTAKPAHSGSPAGPSYQDAPTTQYLRHPIPARRVTPIEDRTPAGPSYQDAPDRAGDQERIAAAAARMASAAAFAAAIARSRQK